MIIGAQGGQVGNVDVKGKNGATWAWGQMQWSVRYNLPGHWQNLQTYRTAFGRLR